MKRFILLLLIGWLCSEIGHAQAQDTLFVSVSQTVHVRFSSELKYVNLGSRDIVAKIVEGSKDFVALRAREPFDFCTSLSCLETNGTMHTFWVAYREHPSRLEVDTRGLAVTPGLAGSLSPAPQDTTFSFSSFPGRAGAMALEEVAAMRQELYHIGVSGYGLQILCENLFYRNDVLYMVVSVQNKSAVSYELSTPRFAVESSRRGRRGLQYEKSVFPRAAYGMGVVAPSSVGRMVFTFDKLALTRGQVFRVYFYEKGGARNLVMTLNMKDINKAKRL